MSDREMLEFAAKAAGYGFIRWETDEDGVGLAVVNHGYWQPLYMNTSTSCDGDALRLAVKLCMSVTNTTQRTSSLVRPDPEFGDWIADSEPHLDDPYAATRRAIVRAAAEIGRQMP